MRLLNMFQQCFICQFFLGLVDFGDIAILCNRPNNCFKPNPKSYGQSLLLSSDLFS